MQRLDAALARPAAKQLGLATRSQFLALGATDEVIERRLDAGVVRAIHPGVYLYASWPFTHETRQLAAVLACGPTAVLSHRSAAVLHGFEGIRRVRPELTVVGTRLPLLDDVTLHRTDTLDPIDRSQVGVLPVTSKARTLLDLGAVVPFELVYEAVHAACVEKLVTHQELLSVLDRVGKRGRRGTASLRAILREALPDERLASMLERDLLALIRRAGVPEPELQHRLVCADGRVVVLDFAWPALKFAIEADGHRWHATPKKLEADNARRRSIRATGWTLDAYGFGDVHARASKVLAEIRASLSDHPS
ncbi:MAG: hypothetical protein JWN67_2442 [Actinomycetia bacterium]|nr:hypothetical protein [Actinomycetes bacterium]